MPSGSVDRLTGAARRPRRRGASRFAPEPPTELPPGRLVHVGGRGEFFVRDTGRGSPTVLLLHGWTASADLNWFAQYATLAEAGYRVLALDHRGHGRGLRSADPFRLSLCAEDAAAVVRELGVDPVLAVGYSMGGPITQLLARDHGDLVGGIVLCATSREWRNPRMTLLWRGMGLLRLILGLFPNAAWRAGLRALGLPDDRTTSWVASELSRGSARDIAEAGRELGRFDSRPWIGALGVPAAVIVTTRDTGVPPSKQRALAQALGGPVFDVSGDHMAVSTRAAEFNRALLGALSAVGTGEASGNGHRPDAAPLTDAGPAPER